MSSWTRQRWTCQYCWHAAKTHQGGPCGLSGCGCPGYMQSGPYGERIVSPDLDRVPNGLDADKP